MGKRAKILLGMAAGMAWAICVLLFGRVLSQAAVLKGHALEISFFVCGIVLLAMIGRLAQQRFFDDTIIDGEPFAPGSSPDINQRVLTNTVEQLVLAICLWPFIGKVLGEGTVLALAGSFLIARLLFWVGYHISPPMRALGFAATFYSTILAAIVALIIGLNQGFFALS